MTLRYEPLEPRRLMAFAAYSIDVPAVVAIGQSFDVSIRVEEFSPFHDGLRSASVTLSWDTALLAVVDSRITDSLPALRRVVQGAGTLDLAGSAILSAGEGRAVGSNGAETFATITMTALGSGAIDLALSESGRTVTVPTASLESVSIRYDSATVVGGRFVCWPWNHA